MTLLRIVLLGAALVVSGGAMRDAQAQQWGMMQGQWGQPGSGYMMGPWMMGPQGMMGPEGMGPGMMGWYGQGAAMCGMMTAHIEGRLAYLRTELAITEGQGALWEAYAASARENAQAMADHCTAMMGQGQSGSLNLPARLDLHERMMAAQLDAMRAVNASLKPLYEVLDADQKAMADRLLWGPMGMM